MNFVAKGTVFSWINKKKWIILRPYKETIM